MELASNAWLSYAMIALGVVTLALRVVKPEFFAKLGPMQEKLGAVPGYLLHTVFYSILPIGYGVWNLLR